MSEEYLGAALIAVSFVTAAAITGLIYFAEWVGDHLKYYAELREQEVDKIINTASEHRPKPLPLTFEVVEKDGETVCYIKGWDKL